MPVPRKKGLKNQKLIIDNLTEKPDEKADLPLARQAPVKFEDATAKSRFVSSIKALNLEPRRARPPPRPAKLLPADRPVAGEAALFQPSLVPTSQEPQSMQPPAAAAPTTKKRFRLINVAFRPSLLRCEEDARPGESEDEAPAIPKPVEPESSPAQEPWKADRFSEPDHDDAAAAPEPSPAEEPAMADRISEPRDHDDAAAAPSNEVSVQADGAEIGVYHRTLMLLYRDEVHEAVQGLCTAAPEDQTLRPTSQPAAQPKPSSAATSWRERAAKQGRKPRPTDRPAAPLKPSPNAWKVAAASTRKEELERSVRSLLNKICPENLKTIVERLTHITLGSAVELEVVINVIFQKALEEPYFCETYADMVFELGSRYPDFPPESEEGKRITSTRVLLNACQKEFEDLPKSLEPTVEEKARMSPEDLGEFLQKRKGRILANLKFIGNLFLRKLLSARVIGNLLQDLLGFGEEQPKEHMIECACELLEAIGYTLDAAPNGSSFLVQCMGRLADLKRLTLPCGRAAFSKRIQFRIQDLLDLRGNQWQKKLFKEPPKTKEDVRRDAVKEARQAAKCGAADVGFSTQRVGVRPAYIEEPQHKPSGEASRMAEASSKPTLDKAHVKRVLQYFAEDKDSAALVDDWQKAGSTPEDNVQGTECLVEIGFHDASKEDVVAEMLTALVKGQCVGWDHLRDAITRHLDKLEDLKLDVPRCDLFYHSLLARLLTMDAPFDQGFLKPLAPQKDITRSLLTNAMRRVKQLGGVDAVRRALEHEELVKAISKSRGCNRAARCKPAKVAKALQDEGIL